MKWTHKGHQFDALGSQILKVKRIYIFGAGENGQYLYSQIKGMVEVCGFIDNDVKKQQGGYLGKPVCSLQQLSGSQQDFYIVVAASQVNTPCIVRQLEQAGYTLNVNLFVMKEYLEIFMLYGSNKLYIDNCTISITQRCTLNCEKCSVLTPNLKAAAHYDVDTVRKDADILFNAVDMVNVFGLLGGEPFLHPELYEIVDYIGSRYRKQINRFVITTNATILPSEKLLDLFVRDHITVVISDYTEALPNLKKAVAQFLNCIDCAGIDCEISKTDRWIDFGYDWVNKNDTSEADMTNFFDRCKMPCRLMQNGTFYYCANSKFAINAEMNKQDPANTYDLSGFDRKNKKTLFEFDSGYNDVGYINMCRKCNGYLSINQNFVEVAKQAPHMIKQS